MEKSSKNKSKFQREISLMKDMMKLAKKRPLKENCITYEDPETVALQAKIQAEQPTQTQSSHKNRRIGFPRLFSYCSDANYYYLVMQLLGANLKELKESFKECKFTIQTTIIIALQLMNRLQSLHS
jgi:serine/threonine protein kinase